MPIFDSSQAELDATDQQSSWGWSFPSKLATLCAGAVILTASVVTLVAYLHLTDLAHRNAFSQLYSEANLNAELLKTQFEGIRQDARLLTNGPTLSKFATMNHEADHLASATQEVRTRLADILKVYLESRPFYTQLHVVKLDDGLHDILSITRDDNGPRVQARDQLRRTGEGSVFDVLSHAPGPHFSTLLAEDEFVNADGDQKLLIRLIQPLKDANDAVIGALVIYAAYEEMVRSADPRLATGHELTVVTTHGDVLTFHQQSDRSKLIMRNDPEWADSPFPHIQIDEDPGHDHSKDHLDGLEDDLGGISDDGLVWHAADTYHTGVLSDIGLNIIATVHQDILKDTAWSAIRQTLWVIAGLVAATLVVAWGAATRLSAPLTDLAKAIQMRRSDHEPLIVDIHANDEIGRVAAAFTALTNDLVSRTNQATALFEKAADGIVTFDQCGKILSTNPSMDALFGYKRNELVDKNLTILWPPDEENEGRKFLTGCDMTREDVDGQFKGKHMSGRIIEVEASVSLVESTEDSSIFVGIFRDISVRCAAERELLEQTEVLQQTTRILEATFDSIEQGVLVLDSDLRLLVWSSRFAEIMEPNPKFLRRGVSIQELIGHFYDLGDFQDAQEPRHIVIEAALRKLGISGSERKPSNYIRARSNGRYVEVFTRIQNDGGIVITLTDVTRQEEARLEIERLAMTDALTGLANRNLLRRSIKKGMRDAERRNCNLAFMLIDLDKFKLVNDVFGHDAGDHVLIIVAKRLRNLIQDRGTLFRLGGDEFAVCLPFNHDQVEIGELADQIIAELENPILFEGRPLAIGASIGIAVAPVDARKAETLQRKADVALYQAKNGGRGLHHFYDEQLDDQERRTRQIHDDLHSAVTDGQFELYFQPRVDAASMKICGAEALLRWNHPTEGLLAPADFISAMERSEAVFEVGEWVIREGWRHLVDWIPRFDMPDFQLSVNVAARQFFEPSLLELLHDLRFSDAHLVNNLELELTEEVMIDNMSAAVAVMKKIEELGYSIAIDDFGTGYSSISYLHHMPVRILKIDKSFLEPVDVRANAATIVKTIINLGRSLGITVTAEGVETAEHVEFLKKQGCTYLQGYYFSKPVPVHQFEDLLKAQIEGSKIWMAS